MHLSTQTIVGLTGNILVMPRSFDPATPLRAVVFVVALVVLLVAHQVGDHVIQTDHQAAGKAGSGVAALWAMLGHLAGYHAVAGAAAGRHVRRTRAAADLVGGAGGVGVLGYSPTPRSDRRWPVRAILRGLRSPQFAETTGPVCGLYAADQALHQLALLGSALLVAGL
jgi:hypothetical protein